MRELLVEQRSFCSLGEQKMESGDTEVSSYMAVTPSRGHKEEKHRGCSSLEDSELSLKPGLLFLQLFHNV